MSFDDCQTTVELVYHSVTLKGNDSPFNKRALQIANRSPLRIASPYATAKYLRHLISRSSEWRWITDLNEVFIPLHKRARGALMDFITEHATRIRHLDGLHAKVLIGTKLALVGSANFTQRGMIVRVEMSVYFANAPQVAELSEWFDALWRTSAEVPLNTLAEVINSIPVAPIVNDDARLFPCPPQNHVAAQSIKGALPASEKTSENAATNAFAKPIADIRRICPSGREAKGHYDGDSFVVLKGSIARGRFVGKRTNEMRRRILIENGVLKKLSYSDNFEFTRDYRFDSSTQAACIVLGMNESGPVTWGSP